MMVFQSNKFSIDLSSFGITLNEENDIFTDSINKSYSLPFTISADAEILEKLDLPTLENIINVNSSVKGKIILPNKYYEATLFLGEVFKKNIEAKITFGDEDLPIYAVKLKDLPWPAQLAGNLTEFAKTVASKSWPSTAYNFPMVYDPSISKNGGYDAFLGFVNNYKDGSYIENYVDNSGEEDVYVNQNVLAPFPYLLEILRFGYKTAGKKAVGEIFQHEDLKKAVYIPKNFLEKMNGSQYLSFSFATRSSVIEIFGKLFNVYRQELTPENVGVFEVSIKLNFDPVLADQFRLWICRKNALSSELTYLQEFQSAHNRVQLDEKHPVEVTADDLLDPIVILMYLPYTDRDISDLNNFEIEFADGQLNVFPTNFTLSDFVPEMTFGEYVNLLKNWWNFEINMQERAVVINFVESNMLNKPIRDHEHLETNGKKRTSNNNRFYKLSYDKSGEVFYTKDGQIFSDLDKEGLDVIEIKMDCQNAVVEMNKGILTAVAREERSSLDFCLYDGFQNNLPVCPISLAPKLSIQQVFANWWQNWLRFRVNSYSFKDSFDCSPNEIIDIKELSRKYNELHIIKKLNRKIKSEKIMQVDVESETF